MRKERLNRTEKMRLTASAVFLYALILRILPLEWIFMGVGIVLVG